MDWKDDLTVEERKSVEELRRRNIQDCSPKTLEDETLFYRFMKARDFNLKKAEEMLKKHIAWRKEYEIDTLLRDYKPSEIVVKFTPATFLGFTKTGELVRHVDVGRSDSRGILQAARSIDILQTNLHIWESDLLKLQEHSKKLGRTLNKIVYIYNFDQMTFAKATNKKVMDFMVYGTKMYQDNYPEHIKNIYVVNASIYFKMMFSVLKTVIDAPVIEKIKIFGTAGYQEALLEVIDADVLPAFLGGDRTDPDGNPNCDSFMVWGLPVPESLHLSPASLRCLPDQLHVPRLSREEVSVEVKVPGSHLEWEFETENGDIGFRVGRREDEGVEVVALRRVEARYKPEKGRISCDRAGTYVIVFDNSYSWINSKEVYYRIEILDPDGQKKQ